MWDPDSNELAIEAVRKYPNRFGIMGWFYLDDPNGRDLVAHWKERPGVLGLRFYFNERHKREWMTDGTLDWLWPAAERAGVPIALAAALFLPTVGEIAGRHPGLKLIVDHMAVPPGSKGEPAYRFQPELLALAKYPNVAVKATGQIGYADDGYPFRSFHDHLHRCFDAFGPERMFWVPTSPGCPVRGGNASRCSPRSCRGLRAAISTSSWVKPSAIGWVARLPA